MVCVWPFGFLDYGSAMLCCIIGSLPFLGLRPHALHPGAIQRKGRDPILPSGNHASACAAALRTLKREAGISLNCFYCHAYGYITEPFLWQGRSEVSFNTPGGRLQPGVTTALKEHMLTLSFNSFILRFHPSVAKLATEGWNLATDILASYQCWHMSGNHGAWSSL